MLVKTEGFNKPFSLRRILLFWFLCAAKIVKIADFKSILLAQPLLLVYLYLEQIGKVITLFLHNEPLKTKDIANLTWVTN